MVYTLASLKDDGIIDTSSAQVNGDFNNEYSRSLLDRRHRIAFSGTFDIRNGSASFAFRRFSVTVRVRRLIFQRAELIVI